MAVLALAIYENPTVQLILVQLIPVLLANQLLGVLLGALVGGLGAWFIQRRSLMFEHRKDLIERIYAPLFDELTDGRKNLLDSLKPMEHTEWDRIQNEHLSHWIEPPKLKELLTEIYGKLAGQLVSSTSDAQNAVTTGLGNYMRTNWIGPATISFPFSPGVTEAIL